MAHETCKEFRDPDENGKRSFYCDEIATHRVYFTPDVKRPMCEKHAKAYDGYSFVAKIG